jgi:serine/threonine protein phosphatase PrpC
VKDYLVQMTSLKIDCFGQSDIGLVREVNEDAWLAQPEKGLFLLADGMGGHNAGEIASATAVHSIAEFYSMDIAQPDALRNAIVSANRRIYEQGSKDSSLSGMGTTISCLVLHKGEASIAHVGDSRIYLLRQGKLRLLTEDHSLTNELLDLNVITTEEAGSFPYKHILTRALGTHPKVEASFAKESLVCGDLFLLCSDGLTNFVSDEEIVEILQKNSLLEEKANNLIVLAKNYGGVDNITVLLVKVNEKE